MRARCGLCDDCQCQCQCQGLGGSQSRLWGKLTCAFGASVNSRFPAKYPTTRVEPPPCSDWIATRNATGVPSNLRTRRGSLRMGCRLSEVKMRLDEMCKDHQIKVRVYIFLLLLPSFARSPLICEPDWVHVLGKSTRPTRAPITAPKH
jgi:hypothetical protein